MVVETEAAAVAEFKRTYPAWRSKGLSAEDNTTVFIIIGRAARDNSRVQVGEVTTEGVATITTLNGPASFK